MTKILDPQRNDYFFASLCLSGKLQTYEKIRIPSNQNHPRGLLGSEGKRCKSHLKIERFRTRRLGNGLGS